MASVEIRRSGLSGWYWGRRRHHHIGLHGTHQQLEIDVAVLAETGDALSRFDAKRVQGIGNAIGLGIEFGEARLAFFEFVNNRVTERLRACADHVGKVRGLRKSGHVSPVVIFLLSGVWRHPAAKTIRGYIRCRL